MKKNPYSTGKLIKTVEKILSIDYVILISEALNINQNMYDLFFEKIFKKTCITTPNLSIGKLINL